MTINIANTGYEALSAGVLAAFFAQVIKFFIFTIKSKKVNFKSKRKNVKTFFCQCCQTRHSQKAVELIGRVGCQISIKPTATENIVS